eukprot:CAMPEP_0196790412 /NCGR_PEP_ID=MMETSP1104-20130614/28204_1 /TAXON_ID=33652 /ORGANISM="Cafeteria sp., Strain Caron Lab Isolate" /LENGTH=50 /DNA_ID=CAMNT_0042160777 /DNA_START=57 /DNA_END=205 /DNA_ORIENTATION=+
MGAAVEVVVSPTRDNLTAFPGCGNPDGGDDDDAAGKRFLAFLALVASLES